MTDIKDGADVPLENFKARDGYALLRLAVDPTRCWVSDLNAFDDLKQAVADEKPRDELLLRANHYWQALVRLDSYEPGAIQRPEVMITYDLKPEELTIA